MRVGRNTSLLMLLGKIGQLNVLWQLYDQAREQGLLSVVSRDLDRLIAIGLWITEVLYQRILQGFGM